MRFCSWNSVKYPAAERTFLAIVHTQSGVAGRKFYAFTSRTSRSMRLNQAAFPDAPPH